MQYIYNSSDIWWKEFINLSKALKLNQNDKGVMITISQLGKYKMLMYLY